MKYAPMTRFERRGEDPHEAANLRHDIAKACEPLDARTLQQIIRYIEKKRG